MKLGFNNITKIYGDKIIAQDFTLLFESAKIICVMGLSGCGKTTLLNIAANLTPVEKGSLQGFSNKKISYIFQEPRLLPFMNILENITLVMKHPDKKRAQELIELVNLAGSELLYPDELSGGMQQRVSFARALAYDPDIILADEPASNLDIASKESLYQNLQKYSKENHTTVLMVTHDPHDCVAYADEAVILSSAPVNINYRTEIRSNDDKEILLHNIIDKIK